VCAEVAPLLKHELAQRGLTASIRAQGVFRGGDRFARHWHDLTRLDAAGFSDAAIDYQAAVCGKLLLVPEKLASIRLGNDYQHTVDDGLFLDEVETFDALIQRCAAIQDKANTV
jgi:hypothetical protein